MTDQEKAGRVLRPLPANEHSPLNELANSLPATIGTGSDNLRDAGNGLEMCIRDSQEGTRAH